MLVRSASMLDDATRSSEGTTGLAGRVAIGIGVVPRSLNGARELSAGKPVPPGEEDDVGFDAEEPRELRGVKHAIRDTPAREEKVEDRTGRDPGQVVLLVWAEHVEETARVHLPVVGVVAREL